MYVLKTNKRTTVLTLLASGASQREIARLTGVDRKTIRNLAKGAVGADSNSPTLATGPEANSPRVATGSAPEIPPPRPPAPATGPQSMCEPYRVFIEAQLHEQAFRYFGGTTAYVVLDNLKEGVLKPDLYEPELNPVYNAMLAHYGVVADPARVRDPNRKGTVEHAIGHTQATALKGRRFESIEDQNAYLEQWEVKWAAPRIHGSAKRQVEAMFQEERPYLQALPLQGFAYFTECERTVADDTCIRIDHSSYAARPAAIGNKVVVRLYARQVEIRERHTLKLLRTHPRAQRPGSVLLPDDERPFNPSRETRRILAQAGDIGASTLQLCQRWFEHDGRVGQRKLRGVVGLAKRFPRRLID